MKARIADNIKNKLRNIYHSGALHIILGTFATKFVAFFGSIVVVRLISKAEYGLMSYVENIYSYAFIFAGLGLSNGMLRYLVVAKDEIEKKSFFNYIIRRSMAVDCVIALLMVAFAFVWKIPENYSSAKYLIPVVALLLPFQDLLNENLFTVRTYFKNRLYAYLAFISSTTLIIGRMAGAVIGGVSGILWSRVIINAAFSVGFLALVLRMLLPKGRADRLDKENRRIVNSYSFQYMITNGIWAVFMLNDTFLLGMLLDDPGTLADYKVAYVLPGNISIFATAIGTFVGPYFTKNENHLQWVRKQYVQVFSLSALSVGAVAAVVAFFAEPLIQYMYGEQYLNTVGLMRILLLAAFINSAFRYTTANLLAAMGQIKYNMIISGVGILIQLALDFILIPSLGAMGVAVSNCVVFSVMSLSLFAVFYMLYYR